MPHRLSVISVLILWGAIAALAAASFLMVGFPQSNVAPANVDQWRRTADGWELAAWKVTPRRVAVRGESTQLNVHPAALALAQLLTALLALNFTAPSAGGNQSFFAAVSRSFRDSAFGS